MQDPHWFICKQNKSEIFLRSLYDYMWLMILGGIASIAGAIIGASFLLLTGHITTSNEYFYHALHWWMGDTLGITVFTTLILIWWQKRFQEMNYVGIVFVGLSWFVGQIVFLNWFHEYFSDTPKGYFLFLTVSLVALKGGIRWTTVALAIVAIQALTGAYQEIGFFAHDIARAELTNYWAYMLIISIVGMAISTHIGEIRQAEEQIRNLAFYDTLTQLPNRRLFYDRLSLVIAASKRNGGHAAMMVLDLDNFKSLNDTHGHLVGDLLLIEVASRLKGCVREVDSVGRFGGDEFVVLLSELDENLSDAIAQANAVAEKIRVVLSEPYLLKIQQKGGAEKIVEHHCSASLGVVMFVNHDGIVEDIIKWADIAMYQAKAAGGNVIRFYDAET